MTFKVLKIRCDFFHSSLPIERPTEDGIWVFKGFSPSLLNRNEPKIIISILLLTKKWGIVMITIMKNYWEIPELRFPIELQCFSWCGYCFI